MVELKPFFDPITGQLVDPKTKLFQDKLNNWQSGSNGDFLTAGPSSPAPVVFGGVDLGTPAPVGSPGGTPRPEPVPAKPKPKLVLNNGKLELDQSGITPLKPMFDVFPQQEQPVMPGSPVEMPVKQPEATLPTEQAPQGPSARELVEQEVADDRAGYNWKAAAAGAFESLGKGANTTATSEMMDRAEKARMQKLVNFDKRYEQDRQKLQDDLAVQRNKREGETHDETMARLRREQDPNSPESRALQQYFGTVLKGRDFSGMSYALLDKASPLITAQFNAAESEKLKFMDLERSDKQIKSQENTAAANRASQERIAGIQANTQLQIAGEKAGKKKAPSEKLSGEIFALNNALQTMDAILEKKKGVNTGTGMDLLKRGANLVGQGDVETEGLRADLVDNLSKYVQSISGSAASDRERAFLMQSMPLMTDADDVFIKKAQEFQRRARSLMTNKIKSGEASGADMSFIRDEVSQPVAKSEPAPTLTPGYVQNGYTYRGGDPKDPKNWSK